MALRLVRTPLKPLMLGFVLLVAVAAAVIFSNRAVLAPYPAAPREVVRQVQPAMPVDQVPSTNTGNPAAQPAQGTTKIPPGPPDTRPIASTAPPSSDAVDSSGSGHIVNIEPGGNSGLCTTTKGCR